jgi:helix-turn-helix protein
MARGRKSPYVIFLSPTERAELEHWQRSTTIQAGLARRAKIILLRADGLPLSEIACRLAIGRRIVRKWLRRFINKRLPGLVDKPGRGRQPVFSPRSGRPSGQDGLRETG